VFNFVTKKDPASEHGNHLFDHSDDKEIHVALASLLYHVISADHTESRKEKHEFASILKDQFDLNEQQVAELYSHVKKVNTTVSADLKIIEQHLKHNPHLRLAFMKKLNHLIAVAGLKETEMEIFYSAQKILFPEIDTEGDDFD
tara:strand:- start:7301 stop:7732 length:432 start_codon:yes stop_codon:yes gene_type:complete